MNYMDVSTTTQQNAAIVRSLRLIYNIHHSCLSGLSSGLTDKVMAEGGKMKLTLVVTQSICIFRGQRD